MMDTPAGDRLVGWPGTAEYDRKDRDERDEQRNEHKGKNRRTHLHTDAMEVQDIHERPNIRPRRAYTPLYL